MKVLTTIRTKKIHTIVVLELGIDQKWQGPKKQWSMHEVAKETGAWF